MSNTNLIANTEAFVKDKLAGEGTGHDWWHVVRVVNTARLIHAKEGGDWLIIELALLLHDVGDRKVIHQDDDDYTIAENFLVSQKVPDETIQRVMSIIKAMSFSKSFDSIEKDDSIEHQIVQDADRLDAIGAIGIARAFAYGGSRSRPLYDPDHEVQQYQSSKEYKKAGGSTYHHFYEKLLLIKSKLNTATAKEIAEERDAFMKLFLEEFLSEWNGER